MTAPTCATCRWWQGNGHDVMATCKRMPPIGMQRASTASILSPPRAEYAVWQRTGWDQWCGEHAPKGEG